jgi:hypothetical protein
VKLNLRFTSNTSKASVYGVKAVHGSQPLLGLPGCVPAPSAKGVHDPLRNPPGEAYLLHRRLPFPSSFEGYGGGKVPCVVKGSFLLLGLA